MTELPPLDAAEFPEFFSAVYGYAPFPWQTRLAGLVAVQGWPGVLDLPTGAGKTAAIDVAVFALALDAGRSSRTAARRIAFVVDRRTIVDQAFERAQHLARILSEGASPVVARVSARLRSLSLDGPPLLTAQLRGGIARDDGWARTPDQPLVVVSTVDQVGSRLLFRGYGVSDEMKPVHAGLLGNDVLYLLDEVHLSQPFRETLHAVAHRYRGWASAPLAAPFGVVEMSATVGEPQTSTFHLEAADRDDSRLSPRLTAPKPAALIESTERKCLADVYAQVRKMLGRPGAAVAVVMSRVNRARDVHRDLVERLAREDVDVVLITGRMRPWDRDSLERAVIPRIRSGRTRSERDRPIVVVATQCIEAGADFDFDALVTECASLDALRQRFGRLDRLGDLGGTAAAAVIALKETLSEDPIYGEAVGNTWRWLSEQANGESVDFGITAMQVPLDAAERGLLAPRLHAPVLLPAHLDSWVQTSPVPTPDPDVSLWLHGPKRGAADVQVVWRADLTEELLQEAVSGEGHADRSGQVAVRMVEALHPGSAEALSAPFISVKRWLAGLMEPQTADVEGMSEGDEDTSPRARAQVASRPAVLWRGDGSRVIRANELRPGQTVVVPASYGGITDGTWDPSSTQPVNDVAERAVGQLRREIVVRLHPAVAPGLLGASPPVPSASEVDDDVPSDRDLVMDWLAAAVESQLDAPARTLGEELVALRRWCQVERLPLGGDPASGEYFVVHATRRGLRKGAALPAADREVTDGDDSSFTGGEVTLANHLAGVAAVVGGFAERLGLSSDVAAGLAVAAWWHDAGKADPRFQVWLNGGNEFKALVQSEPLAKGTARVVSRELRTAARERSGYPKGGRHELGSVALLSAALDAGLPPLNSPETVLHLVASHHGRCRPFAPWIEDPRPIEVAFNQFGIAVTVGSAYQLERLDSGVAERFWHAVRHHGWWGHAWLDTLLRLADHRQSEREQEWAGRHA